MLGVQVFLSIPAHGNRRRRTPSTPLLTVAYARTRACESLSHTNKHLRPLPPWWFSRLLRAPLRFYLHICCPFTDQYRHSRTLHLIRTTPCDCRCIDRHRRETHSGRRAFVDPFAWTHIGSACGRARSQSRGSTVGVRPLFQVHGRRRVLGTACCMPFTTGLCRFID